MTCWVTSKSPCPLQDSYEGRASEPMSALPRSWGGCTSCPLLSSAGLISFAVGGRSAQPLSHSTRKVPVLPPQRRLGGSHSTCRAVSPAGLFHSSGGGSGWAGSLLWSLPLLLLRQLLRVPAAAGESKPAAPPSRSLCHRMSVSSPRLSLPWHTEKH